MLRCPNSTQTLLSAPTEFPSGPVELPAEQHPSLGLEWSATGRLKIHNPDDPLHKKRLIMRKVMSGDTSGKACWAWYCWVCLPHGCTCAGLACISFEVSVLS